MSQRKLKKLRRLDLPTVNDDKLVKPSFGFRRNLIEIIRTNWKYLLLMTLLIVGVYFNSLHGDFVSDDYASITQNQRINNFSAMFSYGNSMDLSTYFVNLFFGNLSPVPYHVLNLTIYLMFCWLAYIFLEMVFENQWLTRLTMLIFALLPIHVEAVSWISGRIYIILAFDTLLGLLGFVYYLRTSKYKYLLITLISFILGFLTDKPRPFSLFLLVPLYIISFGSNRIKINWAKLISWSMAIFVLGIILAWPYIISRINIVNAGYNVSESIFYNPFFQYPTGLSKYFQLLFIPADLTLYHTMYVFPVWLNWLILLTYLAMVGYFYFKNKPCFFALGFIFFAVLPSIMPVKVSWLVAERYMFLGSFGFALFIALLLIDLSKFSRYIPVVILGLLVPYYASRIYSRNTDWQTNHNLWVNTCQVSPNSHNAWNNIGDDYDKLKQYDNAVKGFTQSTIVKPNYADAFHNRANIFFKTGRLDLARDSYNTALYFSPSLFQTYLSLVQIDMVEKKLDLALQHAQGALKINPNDPQSAYVLAIVYSEMGQYNTAKSILEKIIQLYPNYTLASQALTQLNSVVKPTK